MIYDMSAAPKLARNYEEQKEWNRWDGVGVGRKINKDPKQNSIKSPALCPATGSGSYKWEEKMCVTPKTCKTHSLLNVESVHFSI